MQHGQYELLDFGPSVEIDRLLLYGLGPSEIIYEEKAFKEFVSDIGVKAPMRNELMVAVRELETIRSIFLATLDVFCNSTEPIKLFQVIGIYSPYETIKQLAQRVQDEKKVQLVGQNMDPDEKKFVRMFRKAHPKMKLALDVYFGGYIKVRHEIVSVMCFKIVHMN